MIGPNEVNGSYIKIFEIRQNRRIGDKIIRGEIKITYRTFVIFLMKMEGMIMTNNMFVFP